MVEVVAAGLALAGGAVGQAIGKSPVTGDLPWNKVLAPLGSILFPVVYKLLGGDMGYEEAAAAGATIAITVGGGYSWAKNAVELFKQIFKKDGAN